MADEKKPAKATGVGSDKKASEEAIFLLVGLFLLVAIITGLLNYLESFGLGTTDSLWVRILDYFLGHIWPIWKLVAVIISVFSLIGIIYNSWKLRAIALEEQLIYNPKPMAIVDEEKQIIEPKNEKWEKVMRYLSSDNSSDWQRAVIEADVMLEEMLRLAGYHGESVGEMLKSVDQNEFLTIDDAWEAHKIRNAVAHSKGGYQLSEREAKHAVALFEKVFKEFQLI